MAEKLTWTAMLIPMLIPAKRERQLQRDFYPQEATRHDHFYKTSDKLTESRELTFFNASENTAGQLCFISGSEIKLIGSKLDRREHRAFEYTQGNWLYAGAFPAHQLNS